MKLEGFKLYLLIISRYSSKKFLIKKCFLLRLILTGGIILLTSLNSLKNLQTLSKTYKSSLTINPFSSKI